MVSKFGPTEKIIKETENIMKNFNTLHEDLLCVLVARKIINMYFDIFSKKTLHKMDYISCMNIHGCQLK
jgi:hypothetical protein